MNYRVKLGIGVLLASALISSAFCVPKYQTVTFPNGKKFDIIAVEKIRGSVPGYQLPDEGALMINYFGRAKQSMSQRSEAVDVLQLYIPVAKREGLSVIIIQQNYPLFLRVFGFNRWILYGYYMRPDGEWTVWRKT